MTCIELIDSIARNLVTVIESTPQVTKIPTKDYGWENYRYSSARFRLAHVEIFNQNKFSVVHCCVFPHLSMPQPIFGFDVIAGENKITGVFLDLSPTVNSPERFTNITVEKSRERPEWGDIFSPHWIACRPTYEEMVDIGDEAARVLTKYIPSLTGSGQITNIAAAQNRYCLNQRKNEHTRKAIINLLGVEAAEEFITQILFPTV